jgi:hypothetical protein
MTQTVTNVPARQVLRITEPLPSGR